MQYSVYSRRYATTKRLALNAAAFALAMNSGNLRKANLPDLARRRCEILARYIEASPLTGAKTLSMMPQIRRLLEES